MELKMTNEEIDKHNETMLIAAAIALGFEDLGDDNYKCTNKQLMQLIAMCIQSAFEQLNEKLK